MPGHAKSCSFTQKQTKQSVVGAVEAEYIHSTSEPHVVSISITKYISLDAIIMSYRISGTAKKKLRA